MSYTPNNLVNLSEEELYNILERNDVDPDIHVKMSLVGLILALDIKPPPKLNHGVYVKNLPPNITKREIDENFYKYGIIEEIKIDDDHAIVYYTDSIDVTDALKDTITIRGNKLIMRNLFR